MTSVAVESGGRGPAAARASRPASRACTKGSRLSLSTDARRAPSYNPHERAAVNASSLQRWQRTRLLFSAGTLASAGTPHYQHKVSSPVNTRVLLQHFEHAGASARDSTHSTSQTSHARG